MKRMGVGGRGASPQIAYIKHYLRHFDYLLAAAVIAMSVLGIVMIYAATNTGVLPQFASLYKSQRLYVITGVALMMFFALVDYHVITRFYIPIYVMGLLLLGVALIIGADEATGTARWIRIPFPGRDDISIQPSEFMKIGIILFLAKLIELKKEYFNHILTLGLIFLCIMVPVALIQMQASLSASLVIAAISLTIIFAGGLYYRTILIGVALIIPAGLALWFDLRRTEPLLKRLLRDYQWERIDTYLRPVPGSDEYRQVQASLFAIGSGKLYGKGFLKNSYIANGFNDFVFAVVAEQFGFVGSAAVLGLMALIIAKCILTAHKAFDLQGKLIAAGVAGMFLFETFVNVSVVTAILPNTGMPFPFLSYGGSTMWVHMIAAGLVINVGLPRAKPMFSSED